MIWKNCDHPKPKNTYALELPRTKILDLDSGFVICELDLNRTKKISYSELKVIQILSWQDWHIPWPSRVMMTISFTDSGWHLTKKKTCEFDLTRIQVTCVVDIQRMQRTEFSSVCAEEEQGMNLFRTQNTKRVKRAVTQTYKGQNWWSWTRVSNIPMTLTYSRWKRWVWSLH